MIVAVVNAILAIAKEKIEKKSISSDIDGPAKNDLLSRL